MSWAERIIVDEKILKGKPVIKGTRIAVEHIINLLSEGWTIEALLGNYPQLQKKDIEAALKYAAEVLRLERIYPLQ